jgi:hypothetical protein
MRTPPDDYALGSATHTRLIGGYLHRLPLDVTSWTPPFVHILSTR